MKSRRRWPGRFSAVTASWRRLCTADAAGPVSGPGLPAVGHLSDAGRLGLGCPPSPSADGGRPTDVAATNTPATWYELASLLGRLHALPSAGGAVARDGGSIAPGPDQDGVYYIGRPSQNLAAAMSALVSVEDAVAPEGREKFEWLRDQVENAGRDLAPQALE